MHQFHSRRNPACPLGHLKHLGKVVCLPRIGDVNDSISPVLGGAIANGGQIRCGVVVAPIGLLNNQGQRVPVLIHKTVQEHAAGPRILHQQARRFQGAHHLRQQGVIERFSPFRELDIEQVVDFLEFSPRLIAEQLPGAAAVGIAALQAHNLLARSLFEILVLIKPLFRFLIERHQIAQVDRIGVGEGLRSHFPQMGNQHPKLRAPIAHMVQPQHVVAQKLQNPGQHIANDRGAQMAHMHFLGNVGAGKVHQNALRLRYGVNAQSIAPLTRSQLPQQVVGLEGQVNEARPRNGRGFAEILDCQGRHDRAGDLARWLAPLFR